MDLDLGAAFQTSVDKVAAWAEALVQHLPNMVAAVLVLILFWLVARTVRGLVVRLMDRVTEQRTVQRLVATAAYVGVIVAGLFVALSVLDLNRTVTSLLAGAGIVGLALGFAFQDIAENFIAGIVLSVRRPFREGDIIETNDFMGTVDHLDLRATVLRTFPGQVVRIPNSDVFQNPLVNYTTSGMRRVDVGVGVSYGDDLEKARRVALEAVSGVEGRDESREPELFYEEFGGSSINFTVRFWIPFESRQTSYLKARSDAVMAIKEAFDREGVSIPFPIRTLDFGEVGGRLLSQELRAASDDGAGSGEARREG